MKFKLNCWYEFAYGCSHDTILNGYLYSYNDCRWSNTLLISNISRSFNTYSHRALFERYVNRKEYLFSEHVFNQFDFALVYDSEIIREIPEQYAI